MKRPGARFLSKKSLNFLRQQAHRLCADGRTWADIACLIGVHLTTAMKLSRRFDLGIDAIKERRSQRRGRRFSEKRAITLVDEILLRNEIIGTHPQQMALPFALWNRKTVQEAIKLRSSVDMPIRRFGDCHFCFTRSMKSISIIALVLSLCATAIAGPLGLEMGQSLQMLNKQMTLTKQRDFVYVTKSTPRPHPDFNTYALIVTPEHGLCKIVAHSKGISTDIYGDGIRSKFDNLEEVLSQKYGATDRSDFLKTGSIWSEPRDWMTALLKQERVLTSYWSSTEDKRLPDKIEAIELMVTAASTNLGIISISYYFIGSDACIDKLVKKKGGNL